MPGSDIRKAKGKSYKKEKDGQMIDEQCTSSPIITEPCLIHFPERVQDMSMVCGTKYSIFKVKRMVFQFWENQKFTLKI